jgi:hypothetical protein
MESSLIKHRSNFTLQAYKSLFRSRDSAVVIRTGYALDGRGVAVQVPVRAIFSPLHVVHTSSGANPVSYAMGTGGIFPRG